MSAVKGAEGRMQRKGLTMGLPSLFLALVGAGAFAAVIFQIGLDSRVAGVCAALVFIAVGVFGFIRGFQYRRHPGSAWVLTGFAAVHLFAIALPILAFRLLRWDEPFSRVEVWGLSGPQFHVYSTRLYSLWVMAVLGYIAYDAALRWRQARLEAQQSKSRPGAG